MEASNSDLSLVAETYAWILMPNHFHMLVKVKEEEEIEVASSTPDRVWNPVRGKEWSIKFRFISGSRNIRMGFDAKSFSYAGKGEGRRRRRRNRSSIFDP